MLSTDFKIGVISADFNLSGKITSLQKLYIIESIRAQMSLFSLSSLMLQFVKTFPLVPHTLEQNHTLVKVGHICRVFLFVCVCTGKFHFFSEMQTRFLQNSPKSRGFNSLLLHYKAKFAQQFTFSHHKHDIYR